MQVVKIARRMTSCCMVAAILSVGLWPGSIEAQNPKPPPKFKVTTILTQRTENILIKVGIFEGEDGGAQGFEIEVKNDRDTEFVQIESPGELLKISASVVFGNNLLGGRDIANTGVGHRAPCSVELAPQQSFRFFKSLYSCGVPGIESDRTPAEATLFSFMRVSAIRKTAAKEWSITHQMLSFVGNPKRKIPITLTKAGLEANADRNYFDFSLDRL